jgi:hypothetical protein
MNRLFLIFLFFTSVTAPLDNQNNSSLQDIEQSFMQIFGGETFSSFKTKEEVPLHELPLKERILCLGIDHWDGLTEEQLIFLFELAFKLNHPHLLKLLYEEKGV